MDYKFKTQPYKHQLDALEKSWNKDTFAYFMEMGTGKTKVLIDNLSILYDKGKINGALIVAPKGVIGTWYNQEIPNHLADHVSHKSVLWQANINQKQQDKLDTLFETGEDLHILIMNVEALSSEKGTRFATKFLNCHKTLMAIDESTDDWSMNIWNEAYGYFMKADLFAIDHAPFILKYQKDHPEIKDRFFNDEGAGE